MVHIVRVVTNLAELGTQRVGDQGDGLAYRAALGP